MYILKSVHANMMYSQLILPYMTITPDTHKSELAGCLLDPWWLCYFVNILVWCVKR